MNVLKKLGMIAVLPIVLIMAGCSSSATPAPSPKVVATAVANPLAVSYGETVTYKDGLTLTVSAPVSYTPSSTSAGFTTANAMEVTMTVKNLTKEEVYQHGYPTAMSDGADASAISDFGSGVGNSPAGMLEPGKSITWNEAFSVPTAASTLIVKYSPDMITYDPATFGK